MDIPKYYVVSMIENVCNSWNSRNYTLGTRILVWEDNILDCYWTVNTSDNFRRSSAVKIMEFEGKYIG